MLTPRCSSGPHVDPRGLPGRLLALSPCDPFALDDHAARAVGQLCDVAGEVMSPAHQSLDRPACALSVVTSDPENLRQPPDRRSAQPRKGRPSTNDLPFMSANDLPTISICPPFCPPNASDSSGQNGIGRIRPIHLPSSAHCARPCGTAWTPILGLVIASIVTKAIDRKGPRRLPLSRVPTAAWARLTSSPVPHTPTTADWHWTRAQSCVAAGIDHRADRRTRLVLVRQAPAQRTERHEAVLGEHPVSRFGIGSPRPTLRGGGPVR